MDFESPILGTMGDKLAEAERERQKKQEEQARQEQLDAFDQRIADLAAMIEKNEQNQDDEFNINAILIQFLEVTLNLKKVMDMCHSIEKVLSCVSEATQFIDSSMNFSDQIFAQMNTESYGFLARMKQKRMVRKTVRNHIGRMKAIIARVEGTMQMGQIMSREFGKLSGKFGKANAKRKKTKIKAGAFPLASQYLAKRKGGEDGASTGGAPLAGEAPGSGSAPAGGASVGTGIDDIL